MKKKLKIAYLLHGLGIGGAGTSMLLLLKSIQNMPYDKFGYSTSDGSNVAKSEYLKYFKDLKTLDVENIYNDASGAFTSEIKFKDIIQKDYISFVDELKANQIDILHINSTVLPHILKAVKENSNIKIVCHVRELLPKYETGLVKDFMIQNINNYSDAIICISDNEAKPFVIHKNLHILANPFDFSVIDNIPNGLFRSKFSIENDEILIGMLGKFKESKGQLLFVKALKHIKEQKSPIKFKFIIMGAQFNPLWKVTVKKLLNKFDFGYEFKKYVKKNKLKEDVILLPYEFDFFENLVDMDIIVRPSLAGDPWGRDIIESMAFNKPIIATGNSEFYVKPNINGYLIKNNDPIEMAGKIIELARDKNKIKIFGDNAFKTIYEKCNLDNYGEKIQNIYNSILT